LGGFVVGERLGAVTVGAVATGVAAGLTDREPRLERVEVGLGPLGVLVPGVAPGVAAVGRDLAGAERRLDRVVALGLELLRAGVGAELGVGLELLEQRLGDDDLAFGRLRLAAGRGGDRALDVLGLDVVRLGERGERLLLGDLGRGGGLGGLLLELVELGVDRGVSAFSARPSRSRSAFSSVSVIATASFGWGCFSGGSAGDLWGRARRA
jgi:hypothetical protein